MSKKFYKIGIVGYGFVGKALLAGFSTKAHDNIEKYCIFDPKLVGSADSSSYDSVTHVVNECDVIFFCVPSPTDFSTGEQDLSILDKVIAEAAEAASGTHRILVIKSTVLPGTIDEYEDKYPTVRFAHNPEFLREATYIKDFINQEFIVVGSSSESVIADLGELYSLGWPDVPFLAMDTKQAELVKYVVNCFLATKVAFFNEIHNICEAFDIDSENLIGVVTYDKRIGGGHATVPGSDGQFGFGGKCFPKDLVALKERVMKMNVVPDILAAVWSTNLDARDDYDWLRIEGAHARTHTRTSFKSRPVYTEEEMKQMDCPLPPEPEDWEA